MLSFPAPAQPERPGPRHLGDIALAYETLGGKPSEDGNDPGGPRAHLVVHGVLHLLGYDHEA